jgi:hypothetical protein
LLPYDEWCVEVKTGSFPNTDSTCGIVNIPKRQAEYDSRIGDKTISSEPLKLCILNQKDNYYAERCMDGYCLNSSKNKTCEKLTPTSIPILKSNYSIIGVTGSNLLLNISWKYLEARKLLFIFRQCVLGCN